MRVASPTRRHREYSTEGVPARMLATIRVGTMMVSSKETPTPNKACCAPCTFFQTQVNCTFGNPTG